MKLFSKKHQNLPKFWSDYMSSFQSVASQDIDTIRFVVLDTETTGFDLERDRILSIGAVSLQKKSINVGKSLELYIKQERYSSESAKIHGIIKNERRSCYTEAEALKIFLNYISNAVLVAHHAYFDITMINNALRRNGLPSLINKVLDTGTLYKKTLLNSPLLERRDSYSLDHIADKFNISKKDRHTALGDAYITALAFMYILNRMTSKEKLGLNDLL